MNNQYDIRDISLAPSGHRKIQWVKHNMPLLSGLEEEFSTTKPFEGLRISLSVHLEAKTAYLCLVLAAGGAQMSVTGSNSLSTQDDVAAALADEGLAVFAYHGATDEEYMRHIEMCLEHKPHIIIDDGGDLVEMIHSKRPDLGESVLGGCEETTTGVIRLKAMEKDGILKFPMVAVNDAKCKHVEKRSSDLCDRRRKAGEYRSSRRTSGRNHGSQFCCAGNVGDVHQGAS